MPVLKTLAVNSTVNMSNGCGSKTHTQSEANTLENGVDKENLDHIQQKSLNHVETNGITKPTCELPCQSIESLKVVEKRLPEKEVVENNLAIKVENDNFTEGTGTSLNADGRSGLSCDEVTKEETKNDQSSSIQITQTGMKDVVNTLKQNTHLIKSSQIKDSPNASSQVTDKMIEEEEKFRVEEEQQMEKVKAEILDELERTGKQERYQRLQNLLSKSQTYSTYLLGRINDRREKEKIAAEREEKRKLKEEQRKKEKDEKKELLSPQNKRGVRERPTKTLDDQSQDSNNASRKKKRKTEEEETPHRAKKTKTGSKSKITEFDEKNPTTFEDKETTDDQLSQSEENVRMINGEKAPDVQPKLLSGGVLRQYQVEGMEWLIGLFENGINGILADEMGLGKTLQSIALITALIEQKVLGPFMIAAPLSTLPNWIAEFKRFAPQVYTILYHGSKDERMEKRRKMMRIKKYSHGLCSLPVVITSYEIVMRDRIPLSSFNVEWKYLIVDEGHRLKNLNCKLIRELKLYDTGNRLLLTGTPLQNNLAELWSLLNFLLPDIFDDLTSFQRWFDFSAMSSSEFIAEEQETSVLQTLHSILTPFLLRRLKTDVDLSIPPKKEVLVNCPLTVQQQTYYRTTLDKSVLDMISKKNESQEVQEYTESGRPRRKSTKNINYLFPEDEDDDVFDFDALVCEVEAEEKRKVEIEAERNKKKDKKAILNIKLINIMMMLRKCCNHPYLLEYPFDSTTNQLIIDERLLNCSGKLLMMDRMLEGLKERGHKVLIFSQMTLMLDIIVDYLNLKKWSYSRLDGTMKVEDRFQNIEKFNTDPDTFLFLLSTRAGGLGLNLMMADTCIIYDSDWNPQVDLQAQDRCHRIGQTKPVIIYRLVTANTIDQRIIERAAKKRKLEKMVIHEKRFKGRADSKAITPTELLDLLESSDVTATVGTQEVITDDELNQLLDRSDLLKMMEKKKSKTVSENEVIDNVDENDISSSATNSKLFTVVETCISEDVVI